MLYGNSVVAASSPHAKKNIKKIVIIVATKNDFNLISNEFKMKLLFSEKIYNSFVNTYKYCNRTNICIIGPLTGSSYSSMIIEILKENKVQKIIFIGWCGSISNHLTEGDILIPEGSFTDEGVSNNYKNKIRILSNPSKKLKYKLQSISKKNGFVINTGIIWTTDAIFRETVNKINYFKNRGVIAVDMETSTLFNLCNQYNIKIISILIISDILRGKKWVPKFNTDTFNKGRLTAAKLAIDLSL